MNQCVTFLHRAAPGTAERNLMKLVEFMGGTVRPVELVGEPGRQAEILKSLIPANGIVIASAACISPELREMLLNLEANVLVYGFDATEPSAKALKGIAGEYASVVRVPNEARVNVAAQRDVCGSLAGLSLETDVRVPFAFEAATLTRLMSRVQRAFFAQVSDTRGRWMLWTALEIPDVNAAVRKGTCLLDFVPGIAPLMMFLRTAAPDAFWHNPAPTACFIVDDPLLRSRYGFLDYGKLMEVVDQARFSVSVAFIPWNYRRSQRRVVEMFAGRPNACSLSVHGCDHTRGEFSNPDAAQLLAKSRLALERMAKHRDLTGLGFDDVMVFPQGLFSSGAMTALQEAGYLAAINSTPYPTDVEDIPLRELLGMAVTKFSGFPLFTRVYPQNLGELAWNLFLGKPAFLVEHHGYFQKGYRALAETIESVNQLDSRLRWTGLGDACARAHWQRRNASGEMQVQFVTDRLTLQNETANEQVFLLTHRAGELHAVTGFVANGERLKHEATREGCAARVTLPPGGATQIRIQREPCSPPAPLHPVSRSHQLKVFLRRNLCEFRDNYIATRRIFGKQPVHLD